MSHLTTTINNHQASKESCPSPSVLGHELQVVSAHDDGSLHLVGDDHALEDAAADGHVAGEGALLVDVAALHRLLGGLEAQPDALVVAHGALLGLHGAGLADEDGILLLVGLLGLHDSNITYTSKTVEQ